MNENGINLGVFSDEDKEAIKMIVAQTGLPLVIDGCPVDIHGKLVLYAFRITAHCDSGQLWPFWKAYYQRFPDRAPKLHE